MPIPPNGCVYVGGAFQANAFSAGFALGSLVCGPYFVQELQEFSCVQAQQVFSPVRAQQAIQEDSQ